MIDTGYIANLPVNVATLAAHPSAGKVHFMIFSDYTSVNTLQLSSRIRGVVELD